MQRLQASEHSVFATAAAESMPVDYRTPATSRTTAIPSDSAAQQATATGPNQATSAAAVAEAVSSTVLSVLGSSVPVDEPLMSGVCSWK